LQASGGLGIGISTTLSAEWLLGSAIGWRGPWGTTYPPNLRLTESDARGLYADIRSLGPEGERMPTALPPEEESTTPFFSLVPVRPGG